MSYIGEKKNRKTLKWYNINFSHNDDIKNAGRKWHEFSINYVFLYRIQLDDVNIVKRNMRIDFQNETLMKQNEKTKW